MGYAVYLDADGHSNMPAYPDISLAQLTDLVAYLTSLTQSDGSACHASATAAPIGMTTMTRVNLHSRPAPAAAEATRFFVQTYDVLPGQLGPFEEWFALQGRAEFLAADDLVTASRPLSM